MRLPNADGCIAFIGYHTKRRGERRPMYRHKLVARTVLENKLGRALRKYALHTCDHAWCVAEDHLYEGDQFDNMADCKARGNIYDRSGAVNPRAKLTAHAVIDIKTRRERNFIYADRYGVSRCTISDIWHGRSWA
jgi:hypothetical protein